MGWPAVVKAHPSQYLHGHMTLDAKRLIRVGTANANQVKDWKEGVSLERDAGCTIEVLRLRLAKARWNLAVEMRRDGNDHLRNKNPRSRSAISRYYYCLYHALRSCAYLYHGGDDHEDHQALPRHIPKDFLAGDTWSNNLKLARQVRNSADYDPFPRGEAHWLAEAKTLQLQANDILVASRTYLIKKGCSL